MAQFTTIRVRRVRDSDQWVAELRDYVHNHWCYGSSPTDALRKLERHYYLADYWKPYVAHVRRAYNLGFGPLSLAQLMVGVCTSEIELGDLEDTDARARR